MYNHLSVWFCSVNVLCLPSVLILFFFCDAPASSICWLSAFHFHRLHTRSLEAIAENPVLFSPMPKRAFILAWFFRLNGAWERFFSFKRSNFRGTFVACNCSVWSKIFCSSSISSWQPLLHLLVVSVFFLSFAYPFPRSYSNACHILFFFLQIRVFLILYLYANRVWNITTVYVQNCSCCWKYPVPDLWDSGCMFSLLIFKSYLDLLKFASFICWFLAAFR